MILRKFTIILGEVIVVAFLSGSLVFANGFKILGVKDAKATAMGEAFIAQADNPSAVTFNPAGLTQLKGVQALVETTLTNGWITLKTPAGVDEKNVDRWQTVPSLFLTGTREDSRLAAGIGITVPNGLSSEWRTNSSARYLATFSDLVLVDINPSLAYKVNNNLSLGAGFSYYYSTASLYSVVDYGTLGGAPGTMDGEAWLEGKGDSWGFNLGALYKLNKKHSFAVTFKSATNVKYYGEAKYHNIPAFRGMGEYIDTTVETDIEYPNVVVLGYAYRPTDKLKLEFNLDWTDSSSMKDLTIDFENSLLPSVVYHYEHRDTFAYKLGMEYAALDNLKLRMGYIYNESATPEKNWRPSLPDTETHFLCLGFGYDTLKNKVTIDGAMQCIFYEKRTIDTNADNDDLWASHVDGEYTNFALAFSLGLTYRF